MNPKEQLAALQKAMQAIVEGAKAAERDLSEDEITTLETKSAEALELKGKIERSAKGQAIMDSIGRMKSDVDEPDHRGAAAAAKSLGEHFVKDGALERYQKGFDRRSAQASEFKAAADPFLVGTNGQTQYGGVVATPLRRLTIADLLAQGTMSATSLTYYTQGTVTGAPTAVAENGQKPSINFAFSPVTETLSKIAALTRVSDEAVEDTDYIVSVINNQLAGRVQVVEEDQILNGSGTSPNLRGILNRSGIQTYTVGVGASNLDGIYHGITLVETGAAQLPADGIVINPTDYEALRLAKDANEQYFGGGPFTGAYGNDGLQFQPSLWGRRTVVTPAIAAGTVLVGAFQQGAQLFRKGGLTVEATNTNGTDFEFNRVTMRAEERVLLAVYLASAFCAITLASA